MCRIPALELHPMPMDDGLSNANRATRMPFCLWPGFMATFGKMGQQQMSAELVDPKKKDHLPFVRVWEIGANMGDCSLLALHCVAAWGLRSAQPRPLLDVELTLFEPIEDALVSLNAAVKAFQQSQHAAGNLAQKPQILVQPIALGPKVGYTQIHLWRASSAEASFVGCHGFQGECEVQEVWMETLDHLLLGDVPPVDLLKIHVQGSELDVLRGAREALRQVIEAMRRFTFPGYIGSTRIRLRQAFLRLLVYEQPEAVLAPLRGAFLRLDRDSDGLLSAADLHGAGAGATTTSSSFLDALFGEASASPEDEEIRSLLAVSGGANGLGFSDFVAVMMPFCVSLEEAQCRLAFQRLAGAEVTLSRQVLVDTVQVGPDVPQAEVEAFHAGLPEELTFADFLELVRT